MAIFSSAAFWQVLSALLGIAFFILQRVWKEDRTKSKEAEDVSDEIYARTQKINQALAEGRAEDVEEAFRDLNRRARYLKRLRKNSPKR